jgi:predicted HTH domain antitoxin
MTTILVQFETDVCAAVGKSPEEISAEMKVAAAVLWYARGLVSQGKAAEIAGLSRAAFLDVLAEVGVPACQEEMDEIREVLRR